MQQLPRLHIGPVMPGWGSWQWLGEELIPEFCKHFDVSTFHYHEQPPDDGQMIVIKHPPSQEWWTDVNKRQLVVTYAPIDYYDSLNAIDADAWWLIQTRRIVVHCHRLTHYFQPYAPVSYINHHLRFITPELITPVQSGPVLWVGVHSNLPPLVQWLKSHELPAPLLVLSNVEEMDPEIYGFSSQQAVTIDPWTPERHLAALTQVRGAIDIKGDDFRSRHKPPTKALDYLASGLPLAMPENTSSSEHLNSLGFSTPPPCDINAWFSHSYLKQCHYFACILRRELRRERIGYQWTELLKN